MELEGTLRATNLPELLQFLSTGKKTGILTFKSGDKQTSLMIHEGRIVNSSNLARPRRMGEMLVNRGFLRRTELEGALAQQKSTKSDKLLGEILLENSLVSTEILKDVIRLQLEEEIWSLFSWKEGTFQFRYSKDKHFSNVLIELDVEPFLLEGSRRLDEWSKIAKNIESENMVISVNKINVEDFEREITLSETEWQVLSLINGYYNVGSLVTRSGLSKFETFRILNSFLVAGLIQIKEDHDISIPFTSIQGVKQESDDELGVDKDKNLKNQIRGVRRLFQKRSVRKAPIEEKPIEKLNFFSPAGVVAYFINTLFQKLEYETEFIVTESDKELVKMLWHEILMEYPRADIIYACNNSLDVRDLEFFIDSVGIDNNIVYSCYEESMAALKHLCDNAIKIISLRLGERAAQRLISSVTDDLKRQITIDYSKNFDFSEFTHELIKT